MHFHAVGSCTPLENFTDAGGHIMPLGLPHGFLHPDGPHAGNLPNLIVAADGTVEVELYTNLLMLDQGDGAILDEDGSTLMIHTNEDDHVTQPIGGSGGRIACGVIEPVVKE
jgi:Cu-Zn family superoxide dismutase